ncbi:hypothetical protein SLA2020_170930 [Shorea laevis]
MGPRNFISILVISFSCLFFSSVNAKEATIPTAAPNSSPTPSPSQGAGYDSSRYFISSEQGQNIKDMNANPTVKSLCSEKDHPRVCVDTLMPYIGEGDPKSKPAAILELAVKLTYDQAREGQALAEKLLADPSVHTSPKLTACLLTCVKSYKAILISNRVTLDAIAADDFYTMNKELSANVNYIDVCENAFMAERIKSPLTRINEVLGKMVVNNLGFGMDLVRGN